MIATELHESARIDRQLFGRCGRQGDPGSAEAIVSLEDELIRVYLGPAATAELPAAQQPLAPRAVLGGAVTSRARQRRRPAQLLSVDDQLGDMLAFSGRGE